MSKKGVVLVITLGIILVVAALSNVILSLMTSQARLSYLQRGRIQAYYAAQAGIHLAMENLRTGAWSYNTRYCINCTAPAECQPFFAVPNPDGLRWPPDPDILPLRVCIDIGVVGADPPGPAGAILNTAPIQVAVDYSSLSL